MTLGLELGRAYVNVVAVLHDGTLVSGLEDGKVQVWRHGLRVHEAFHEMPQALQMAGLGSSCGGVTCLAPLGLSEDRGLAFASGGNACVKLWTVDGDCLSTLVVPMGSTPTALIAMTLRPSGTSCLAASFRRIRDPDPNKFRLVPQDDEQRRRRAQAEAEEAAAQERLARVSRSIQFWWAGVGGEGDGSAELRSSMLEPEDGASVAPITAVVPWSSGGDGEESAERMVCGDAAGGLRLWSARSEGSEEPQWERLGFLQLRPEDDDDASRVASVICMAPLANQTRQLLAVSTEASLAATGCRTMPGASVLRVPSACAVYVVDVARQVVLVALSAHKDAVRCMCAIPDGGLATGGGKIDATVQIWDPSRWQIVMAADAADGVGEEEIGGGAASTMLPLVLSEASKLKEPGYVFALAVLPDTKPGSRLFALAAARYNVVKICL